MSNPIIEVIESRVSTGRYDAERQLSEESLTELIRLAALSPSAYNFQNWKFIAVRTPQAKARLCEAAYGQPQVKDAAATIIVCGTLEAHRELAQALQPSVEAGVMPQAVADGWVEAATGSHQGNPQLQRDEAIRSASLAAMTLMLAAQGMGLSTGPMSGFDPVAVSEAFELSDHELPVMLVTVGYPATHTWTQKPRKPVAEVMQFA